MAEPTKGTRWINIGTGVIYIIISEITIAGQPSVLYRAAYAAYGTEAYGAVTTASVEDFKALGYKYIGKQEG